MPSSPYILIIMTANFLLNRTILIKVALLLANCSEATKSSLESTCLTLYLAPYQKVTLIMSPLLRGNQHVSQRGSQLLS
jgi:hypothetical protein